MAKTMLFMQQLKQHAALTDAFLYIPIHLLFSNIIKIH